MASIEGRSGMGTCPRCYFENANRAAVCGRCASDLSALAAITLTPPLLPAPMVEPIHTPPKPPPDSKPLPACPALTVSFGGKSTIFPQLDSIDEVDLDSLVEPDAPPKASTSGQSSTKAPITLLDVPEVAPATVSHPDDRLAPGGTRPAQPGLSEHPMNDAALQHSQQVTTPSTDMADQSQTPVPPVVQPKLLVLRGLKISVEYPIYEGRNTIGRFADKPVDIDLLSQESVEQIWCSRQHAAITFQTGAVFIEDLNSLNGTWVNGTRVHAGQQRLLSPGDIIQIGTVQMKLLM
jgi:hypothetical protein